MSTADARRFGYCVRCLGYPSADNLLTEHHTEGKSSHRNQVVFVCQRCHSALHRVQESDADAYTRENMALLEKTRLLVSSRALRFVVEHRARFADGFRRRNRDGVSVQISPSGYEFLGPFGAIGHSGRQYYFVPLSAIADDRDHVEVLDPTADGVGGVGHGGPATGGWVRFSGQDGGVLRKFIIEHRKQANADDDLSLIEQT